MLKGKFGKITKCVIENEKITLSRSLFDVLLEGVILISVSAIIIITIIVLANNKIIPESIINSSFPILLLVILILIGKYFVFELFKTPYIIRFNTLSKKIERLNINSNIIDSEPFEDYYIILTNDVIEQTITFCNENKEVAYNIVLNSDDSSTKIFTNFAKNNFRNMHTDSIISTFECVHCKYEQTSDFEYCPKCGKNDYGLSNSDKN